MAARGPVNAGENLDGEEQRDRPEGRADPRGGVGGDDLGVHDVGCHQGDDTDHER